jgi:hypothetical protein
MAPRLTSSKKRNVPAEAGVSATPPRGPTPVAMISPQEHEFRTKLKELREHLTKNADNVGQNFEEARKMHYGEIEHRSIYGRPRQRMPKTWPRKALNFIRCRFCQTSGINTPTPAARRQQPPARCRRPHVWWSAA